jgi:hypothetical protein
MKTIVLTFSRNYPKYHPKAGQETDFINSILKRIKKGTIRGNYERWLEIAAKLEAKTHILSLRYWSDKAYRSKQVEFARVTKIELHTITIINKRLFHVLKNNILLHHLKVKELANDEGFIDEKDFENWFPQEEFNGVLIEFLEIENV